MSSDGAFGGQEQHRAIPDRGWRGLVRRVSLAVLLLIVLLGLLVLTVGCCAFSAPRYHGLPGPQFDGERFHNLEPVGQKTFSDFLRWQLDRQRGAWRPQTDARPGPRPPRRLGADDLRVTFVNHSTVLLQLAGLNVLTDPIWSERASPVSWAGPRRVRPPGICFEELPTIDLVLISHNHYDHLDLATLQRLDRQHRPQFVVGLGNRQLLEAHGIRRVSELGWWRGVPVSGGVTVWAVPAQHFSSRGLCDRNGSLWAGYVLEAPGGPVYFAGDTGYGRHFGQIRQRFGPPRLALLPIGAYRPRWFMRSMHISPAEAVQVHRELQAATSVAIHWGTFPLGDDGQEEPVHDLQAALGRQGVSASRFWVLGFGEGRLVPLGRGAARAEAPGGGRPQL